jgi:small subunit ribosomal protein S20
MPNIKSAKKRVLVNTKKAEQNKSIRSEVKSAIKKVEALVKENDLQAAKIALSDAFSIIDSACSKNILHANNAANKKARLAKKVASLEKDAPVEVKEEVVVEEVKEEVKEEPVKKPRKPRAKKTEDAE